VSRASRTIEATSLAAVLAASLALGAAVAEAATGTVIERIAATVGREPITLSEVQRSAEIVEKAQGHNGPITDEMLGRELDALIEREILRQHMKKVGISVSDAEVDDALDAMLARAGLKSDQVDQLLERQGLSKDEYRDRLRAELERRRVVDVEVRPRVVVEDSDIQRYYDDNQATLSVAERVHIRDIYLPYPPLASAEDKAATLAKARELKSSAASGSVSFEDLAKRNSKGPGADDGGDLGVFEKGKLRPELEEVAFALKPGDVGGPVESGGGVHVIQLVEKHAGGAPPLDEVKSDIREKLLSSALERTYKRWYERLLEESHVERRVQLPSEFTQGPSGPILPPSTHTGDASSPDAASAPEATPAPDARPTEPAPPSAPSSSAGTGDAIP